jgi:hypothetical protein
MKIESKIDEAKFYNINYVLQKNDIKMIDEALRIHDVVGRSEQLKCLMDDNKPNCTCELNHCLKKGW